MAFRKSDPAEEESPGLRREFRALVEESSDHLRTRGELLGLEAREAAAILRRQAQLGLIAAGLLSTAYLLLIVFLVGIIGSLLAGTGVSLANWIGAVLILAVLHLVPGLLVLREYRKSRRDGALFSATLNELRKDQQWLSREKTN